MKILFPFLFVLSINANPAFKSYCKKASFAKDESIYNEISKLKIDLANSKPIAAVADEALGSLIAKKSPIVTSWIKRRKLDVSDPVNVAKQWRLYYIENIVLSSGTFNERPKVIQELLDKELSRVFSELYTKEKVALLEEAFSVAKRSALAVLKIQLGSTNAYKEIEQRLKTIKIFIPKNVAKTKVAMAPRDFLEWGFAYDPKTNEINIGLEGLNFAFEKYRASLVSLMAHEIAHSFDSCRYSGLYRSKNPFVSIQKCLRNSTSAGAKYRDDSQLKFLVQNKVLTKEVGESLLANPTCNRSLYPLPGKQKDQLDEVFADWFSAEVVAHSGIAIDNLRSELCLDKQLREGSSYISNERRLSSIYLTQPTIAKKLGIAENEYRHCSN